MGEERREQKRLVWPTYGNCIANLPNSVLKKFGVPTVGDTLPLADRYLEKDYKNIVVLLLDGMGKFIMDRHLEKDGPFQTHLAGVYNSVFLSTTVAATTSILSGLQPCEHSWLGWDCYYPQIDKNVTVFLNTVQGTEDQAAPYSVARRYTPYVNVIQKLTGAGKQAYAVTPFLSPNPKNIQQVCAEIKRLCRKPGSKYIYGYWNQPDGLLHRNGGGTDIVIEAMRELEDTVSRMAAELEDTLLIVTADHGHIDNEYVELKNYPKLCACLKRWPSLEPRALNLFIKDGMKETFEEEFNREFGDSFILMPMEEVLDRNLFGTGAHHKNFRGMLGDYLAIATGNLSIYFDEKLWLSMHGSVTEDEMEIPFIVFES